jgi:hypothetical protein
MMTPPWLDKCQTLVMATDSQLPSKLLNISDVIEGERINGLTNSVIGQIDKHLFETNDVCYDRIWDIVGHLKFEKQFFCLGTVFQ